jgi:hypothetical protein
VALQTIAPGVGGSDSDTRRPRVIVVGGGFAGLAAVESLRRPTGADVGDLARETIVRTGRPIVAVINDDTRLQLDDAESAVWRSRLLGARESPGRAIRAAGRIEVENHDLDWLGTGWLVADDAIITNQHVAGEFGRRRGEGFVFRQGSEGASPPEWTSERRSVETTRASSFEPTRSARYLPFHLHSGARRVNHDLVVLP